ncbi:MAG: hypothetical protein HKN80_11995 [Acidimicrobiia bacterium]|nr:hypothetical protein [Acidimicrobiia bacterium]
MPGTGVVVLSPYVEPDDALKLFADGSDGLADLLKERVADLGELTAADRARRRWRFGDRFEA